MNISLAAAAQVKFGGRVSILPTVEEILLSVPAPRHSSLTPSADAEEGSHALVPTAHTVPRGSHVMLAVNLQSSASLPKAILKHHLLKSFELRGNSANSLIKPASDTLLK